MPSARLVLYYGYIVAAASGTPITLVMNTPAEARKLRFSLYRIRNRIPQAEGMSISLNGAAIRLEMPPKPRAIAKEISRA